MIGIVLLAHEQLRRTGQVARHLARNGCRVAVHIDARTGPDEVARFKSILGDSPNIVLSPRRRCDWGAFSLVEACLDALHLLFDRWPGITHVCQLSGSCLPIKPIDALAAHLDANSGVDFIDSVPVRENPWVVDGLSEERFTLYHPLPWRRYRWLFDRNVDLQRRLGVHRKIPDGLVPRIGSQWWCLSRETLHAILDDPALPAYRRFFRRSWIPDESFFQTLAAKHARRAPEPPLTFARFDPQGKPFVFYDDHLDLLLNADAFFARKIWGGAQELYSTFLDRNLAANLPEARDGRRMVRRFDQALKRHRNGREGLISQGRHPGQRLELRPETARSYFVLDGLDRVCPDMLAELGRRKDVIAHGHLFAPDRIEFAGGGQVFTGNLSGSVAIRDYKPLHFLTKLVWIERAKAQCFQHDFAGGAPVSEFILGDPNAHVVRIRDAWLIDLFSLWRTSPDRLAAALDDRMAGEARATALLSGGDVRAKVLTLTLQDVLHGGPQVAGQLADHLPQGVPAASLLSGARMPEGLGQFLDELRRSGAGPANLDSLAPAVMAFERMTRVLRRKT